jgi:hypothetical protein
VAPQKKTVKNSGFPLRGERVYVIAAKHAKNVSYSENPEFPSSLRQKSPRSAKPLKELAQSGRRIKHATRMMSEFLSCLVARSRALGLSLKPAMLRLKRTESD